MSNRAMFDQFFVALGKVDIAAIVDCFTEDAAYRDIAVEAEPTVGHDAIRKKLSSIKTFDRIECEFSAIVEDGERILSERMETWYLASGTRVELPVMSIMEFRNGKIGALREYWDMQTVTRQLSPDQTVTT